MNADVYLLKVYSNVLELKTLIKSISWNQRSRVDLIVDKEAQQLIVFSHTVKKSKFLKVFMKLFNLITYLMLSLTLFTQTAESAGKKPSDGGSCTPAGTPSLTTPQPVRKIILQPINTKVFQLPNGTSVDVGTDLQSILNTAVASSPLFEPSDLQEDPCNSHLEIRSTVTNFQLNVSSLGISFGYTPSGSIPVLTNPGVNANMNVQIGTISIDFSIWNCIAGSCSAVNAVTATHLTAGVNLGATINFGIINTGPSFIYNTPIGDIVRQIMVNGMKQLSSSSRVSELPWQSLVLESVPAAGTFVFGSGAQSRIGANQAFEVYAPVNASSSGICNVFEPVAVGHTIGVGSVSSTAMIDQSIGSRGVQVGDVVMIHSVGPQ